MSMSVTVDHGTNMFICISNICCEDVALTYIDGRRQMVCSLLGDLGGAQLVTEEPSLLRRSPALQSKMGVWPWASMALGGSGSYVGSTRRNTYVRISGGDTEEETRRERNRSDKREREREKEERGREKRERDTLLRGREREKEKERDVVERERNGAAQRGGARHLGSGSLRRGRERWFAGDARARAAGAAASQGGDLCAGEVATRSDSSSGGEPAARRDATRMSSPVAATMGTTTSSASPAAAD
ncbi:hypothetical protein Scep_004156 [Stephania cephalantha]|uniref:Uncharacterized protein n=1 Tax=Stephania cephalantha TaxID=152367 RepID=A0AAP0PV36_9MAGN